MCDTRRRRPKLSREKLLNNELAAWGHSMSAAEGRWEWITYAAQAHHVIIWKHSAVVMSALLKSFIVWGTQLVAKRPSVQHCKMDYFGIK